ncbi:hypothetical protein [Methanobrevibacter sp.]|nr:hypothetical protein [Methanobrevibacter sp.]
MNYSQYAIATSPENLDQSVLITPQEVDKELNKSIILERLKRMY